MQAKKPVSRGGIGEYLIIIAEIFTKARQSHIKMQETGEKHEKIGGHMAYIACSRGVLVPCVAAYRIYGRLRAAH